MPYMYSLGCADGTYYVGSTWHVLERVQQHNDGLGSAYMRNRLSVALAYSEEYTSIADAFGREKQVQGRSRRRRRALIEGGPQELPDLVRLQKRRTSEDSSDQMGRGPP
jgi:putative endonuclease